MDDVAAILAEIRAEKARRSPEEKRALEEAWLKENADAIKAYNERIEKHGMLLKPIWEQRTLDD